jgi:hypothetical protein
MDSKYGFDVNLADAWLEAGWNVGSFYWDQLADEDEVTDAEAKIWTADGPQGMRFRNSDGSYSTDGAPNVSVANLFVQSYLRAFSNGNTTNATVHIAGHSLGSQVVGRATNLLANLAETGLMSPGFTPSRSIILDPYMSEGDKPYLSEVPFLAHVIVSLFVSLSFSLSLCVCVCVRVCLYLCRSRSSLSLHT